MQAVGGGVEADVEGEGLGAEPGAQVGVGDLVHHPPPLELLEDVRRGHGAAPYRAAPPPRRPIRADLHRVVGGDCRRGCGHRDQGRFSRAPMRSSATRRGRRPTPTNDPCPSSSVEMVTSSAARGQRLRGGSIRRLGELVEDAVLDAAAGPAYRVVQAARAITIADAAAAAAAIDPGQSRPPRPRANCRSGPNCSAIILASTPVGAARTNGVAGDRARTPRLRPAPRPAAVVGGAVAAVVDGAASSSSRAPAGADERGAADSSRPRPSAAWRRHAVPADDCLRRDDRPRALLVGGDEGGGDRGACAASSSPTITRARVPLSQAMVTVPSASVPMVASSPERVSSSERRRRPRWPRRRSPPRRRAGRPTSRRTRRR